MPSLCPLSAYFLMYNPYVFCLCVSLGVPGRVLRAIRLGGPPALWPLAGRAALSEGAPGSRGHPQPGQGK